MEDDKSGLIAHHYQVVKHRQRRAILTARHAREIFACKDSICSQSSSLNSASNVLAARYYVSPKTIRDIWSGRSWLEATYDLWNVDHRPVLKSKGRPKGRKDSGPRKIKANVRLDRHCREYEKVVHQRSPGQHDIAIERDSSSSQIEYPNTVRPVSTSTIIETITGIEPKTNSYPLAPIRLPSLASAVLDDLYNEQTRVLVRPIAARIHASAVLSNTANTMHLLDNLYLPGQFTSSNYFGPSLNLAFPMTLESSLCFRWP